jgi:hypothetical protein
MNDYGQYDVYDNLDREATNDGPLFLDDDVENAEDKVDFDDPAIASLPRVMLMGPRRAGKTSIQVNFVAFADFGELSIGDTHFFCFARSASFFKKCLHTRRFFASKLRKD